MRYAIIPDEQGVEIVTPVLERADISEIVRAVDDIWNGVGYRVDRFRQGSFEIDRDRLLALKGARDRLLDLLRQSG